MTQYNPKKVFRQISNSILKEYFESRDCILDVEWDKISNMQIQGIYQAFLDLEEPKRKKIEIDLQDIHVIAQSDGGIRILIEEAGFAGEDIKEALEEFDSRYDKAVTVLLNYPEIWEKAVILVHAANLQNRCWHRRCDLPKKMPEKLEAVIEELKENISAFYWQSQGRGQLCRIDHISRNGKLDYFFVYLSDHADTDITWDSKGDWARVQQRHSFEVVFVFDQANGTLDVYALGGKNIAQNLHKIFARAFWKIDISPVDEITPYDVECLKDRSFSFVTDPGDGISQVAVTMLRVSPLGNVNKKITVKLPAGGDSEDIYDSLDKDLNSENMPLSLLRVERATVSMKLSGYGRKRSLTFDIGPKSCTLKSQPERFQELGEKYLRRWKIDKSA